MAKTTLLTHFGHRDNLSSSRLSFESEGTTRCEGIIGAAAALATQWDEVFTVITRFSWPLKASRSSSAEKGLIRTETPCAGNRVHRLRSDVAGHHDGRYVPAKGGTQVPDGLDTIRRATKVVVTQQHIRAQALLSDQSQGFRRRCNNGGVNPSRLQQSPERRAHGRLVLDRENAAQEGIIVRMHRRRCFRHLDAGSTARNLNEKPCTLPSGSSAPRPCDPGFLRAASRSQGPTQSRPAPRRRSPDSTHGICAGARLR